MHTLQLEEQNLGRPTCPDIQINPENWGYYEDNNLVPQAYEYEGVWYYNQPAAILEAEFIGKKLPTKKEWEQIIKEYKFKELSKFLPLSGYRHNSTAGYVNQGMNGHYWSSSLNGFFGYYVTISGTQVSPLSFGYRSNGFTCRCLKKLGNKSDHSSLGLFDEAIEKLKELKQAKQEEAKKIEEAIVLLSNFK